MRTLTIVTGYNRPGTNPKTGQPWQDATGAFLPEARAFRALHSDAVQIDGHLTSRGGWLEFANPATPAYRRGIAESTIRYTPALDVLAVFGHGTASSLIATGHAMYTAIDLADAISNATGGTGTVILYACSTAAGKRGFADRLADQLPRMNIWGHTSAGHATWNPNVEIAGGVGTPIARPGDPLWKRWAERMHDDQKFRLSFWLPGHGLPRTEALAAVRCAI
jgi:hypothetical protein